MKNKVKFIGVAIFILMNIFVSIALASSYKTMYLNKTVEIIYDDKTQGFYDVSGKTVYPISYEGTTYLPIRAITSMFDMTISWNSEANTVYMSTEPGDGNKQCANEVKDFVPQESVLISALLNDEIVIRFDDDIQEFKDVNGKTVYPISYEGTTYLPIRAISGLFELEIEWNGDLNQVIITKPEKENITEENPDKNPNESEENPTNNKIFDYTATYINNENRFAEIKLEKQTSELVIFSLKGVTLSGSGFVVRYPVVFKNGVGYCEAVDLTISLSGNEIILETENESNAVLSGIYTKEGKEQRTINITEKENNKWNGTFDKSETISMTLGEVAEDTILMGLVKNDENAEPINAIIGLLEKTDEKTASGVNGELGEIKRYKITYIEEDKINVFVDTGDIITDKLFNGVYIRKEYTPREMYLNLKEYLDKTSLGEGVTGHMIAG